MTRSNEEALKRTNRRHQLREMVPFADSTIYEMEQRGEFPRRFALSPRCVVSRRPFSVWVGLNHSHSIVPGGFDVTSYTTRLMPRTSLMIRVAAAPRKAMS